MQNFCFPYDQNDLDYISTFSSVIYDISSILGISDKGIAGSVIREMNNYRNVYSHELIKGLGVSIKDLNIFTNLTHEAIEYEYEKALTLSRERLKHPTLRDRLGSVALLDIGLGRIQIRTAIDALRFYSQLYPDTDPLDLKKYNNHYDALVLDLINPYKDTTFRIAGLVARQAEDFYKKQTFEGTDKPGQGWEALTEDQKAALVVKYYTIGQETLEDAIKATTASASRNMKKTAARNTSTKQIRRTWTRACTEEGAAALTIFPTKPAWTRRAAAFSPLVFLRPRPRLKA